MSSQSCDARTPCRVMEGGEDGAEEGRYTRSMRAKPLVVWKTVSYIVSSIQICRRFRHELHNGHIERTSRGGGQRLGSGRGGDHSLAASPPSSSPFDTLRVLGFRMGWFRYDERWTALLIAAPCAGAAGDGDAWCLLLDQNI